jgi:hypothetical protein
VPNDPSDDDPVTPSPERVTPAPMEEQPSTTGVVVGDPDDNE